MKWMIYHFKPVEILMNKVNFISVIFVFPLTILSILAQPINTISRVIDGDTIELTNGKKVRLIGIDTPETKHPTKPVEYFGKEASAFTRQLLQGKQVRLEYDVQETDRYGRLMAYVYLPDGTFVNKILVERGYAQVSTYPPNVKYEQVFLQALREARANNRGLWVKQSSERGPPEVQDKPSSGTQVYVTRTGSKYHQEGCRYLSSSKIPISLEAAKQKYEPCGVRKPKQ